MENSYYEHTVSRDYLARRTRAEVRQHFARPSVLVLLALQLVFVIWCISLAVRVGSALSYLLLAFALVTTYFQTAAVPSRVRRLVASRMPLDTTWGLEIDTTELIQTGPTMRTQTSWSVVREAVREADLVRIQFTDGWHTYFPDLPQQAVDRINKLAGQQKST